MERNEDEKKLFEQHPQNLIENLVIVVLVDHARRDEKGKFVREKITKQITRLTV